MSPADERYFARIEDRLDEALERAEAARSRGYDPTTGIEIPVAQDMADRVENILGIDGVAERVRELEGQMSREEAALELARDFAEGRVGDYDSRAGKVEGAVRTAVALLTEGVVAAPIEGIDRVEILQNDDGTEFVNVYYAGPIRSAGGTAQALSVLVADYTRTLVGLEEFRARDDEIERYAEEIGLYDKETGLQYTPKDRETRFIAEHMPIMLDGEATSDEEVSGFRDLDRVDTNSARGGMCLVLAEGIALKAPKIQRYTRNLDEVDWPWLQDLIDGTIGKGDDGEGDADEASESDAGEGDADEASESDAGEGDAGEVDGSDAADAGADGPGDVGGAAESRGDDDEADGPAGPPRVEPSQKFLRDLIAGRPVFGHPSKPGGFRLRYGRARNHGFATAGVHPATMHLVDDFLATGTQIKTERPGKAAGVVPVDSIEGPTVRLANGDVRRIDDPAEALEVRNGVEAILDLGEYLVNYGEFVENNHPLAPASYTVEWWRQDLAAAGVDVQALRDDPAVDLEDPSAEAALAWTDDHGAPLHPAYTYLWHDVPVEAMLALAEAIEAGEVVGSEADPPGVLVIERTPGTREALESLLVEHTATADALRVPDWRPFVRSLGFGDDLRRDWTADDLSRAAREWDGGDNAVRAVNEVAPFEVRERAPTRIGNRMGRPEKSEKRDLSPAVHALFPIGEAGGSQRDLGEAATTRRETGARGEITVQVGERRCPDCGTDAYTPECPSPDCEGHTQPYYECDDCGTVIDPDESGRVHCERCDRDVSSVAERTIDLNGVYHDAMDRLGERETAFEILKGVKGLTSANKTPEPVEKGVLRAKHGVSSFKDGTVRYDMTDLPVTAVRPEELDVTADHFRELGYETDVDGEPLRFDDQLVELKVQDVVLSDGAAEHMLRTADYVDDLLTSFYDLPAFYELNERDDLVGELVFGMAPHTSAATVGRVVGFTSAAVGYAHPYFHAAKRRNCFAPGTELCYEAGEGTEADTESGEWRRTTIGAFVEERLDDPREDDVGTLISELDGEVRVRAVDDRGRPTVRPVDAVSKHPAPDHLVEVTTASGRSIRVTPDHTMLRWTGGAVAEAGHAPEGCAPDDEHGHGREHEHRAVERVRASELSAGDLLPATTGSRREGVPSNRAVADGGVDCSTDERVGVDRVTAVEHVVSKSNNTYCIEVNSDHTVAVNGLYTAQCDGDEDCVMLLMDGLINFSKEYLPDQRGGSVAADSRLVAFGPDGSVRFPTFDEFWAALDVPVEHDGKFEKKTCLSEGWTTYAFGDDHESAPQPIEKAIRYRADDDETLLRVGTQFGRSIDVTPNHSLFRYDDGIEEVAGDELSEGDLLLAPRRLDVDPVETTVDVVDCVDEPYVFIDDHVEDLLTTAWETTERGSETHEQFRSGLSYRLDRKKIAYDRLERILDSVDMVVPDDVTIGLWGSATGIDRQVSVDEGFAWLLGMFVAEGSLSGFNPTLFNADEALIDRVVETTESALGVEPSVEWSNEAYRVHFPAVFRELLHELGFPDQDEHRPNEKLVPDAILRGSRDVVLAFLRGLLAGDGSEPSDDNVTTLQFHTTSRDVADGLVFLLHRLGLVANVSRQTNRDGNRRDIATVSVSGGGSDNPLRRILDGEEPYSPKSLVVRIPDALWELREMDIEDVTQVIPKYLKRRENLSLAKLREIVEALESRSLPADARDRLDELRPLVDGDLSYLRVTSIEEVAYDGYLYDLQVGGEPIFTADWLYAHNSMDAPLVMSSRIDPSEIDDEAHNMDIVREYPREFYEATREMADPGSVDVKIAEETLGTDDEYRGFDHTHDTTDIHMGPALSAYKTLGSMMEKMDAQLELARKLQGVDETDVAERVIEYHFLPDLIGNLRAFSRQETRCLDCGEKYRRMPLTGECRECGGRVNLTVHRGSVEKYMDTAVRVAEEFDCRAYTKQRLEVLEKSIESVFENDKNKASSLGDFM